MNLDEVTCRKKASFFLKCGPVSGGDCTRQPLMLDNMSEELSLTDFNDKLPTPKGNEEWKTVWLCSMRRWITWKFDNQLCSLPSNLQEHFSKQEWYCGHIESLCLRRRNNLSIPKKMISSSTIQNATPSPPLLLFHLQLGLVVTKINVLLSTFQRIVSTALYSQEGKQEEEEERRESKFHCTWSANEAPGL